MYARTDSINIKKEACFMKMDIDEAKKILREAGIITESAKRLSALYNLEEFFNDLNDILDQDGYRLNSFADFEDELDNAGYAILFTEGRDVDDLDGLYDKIDIKIAKIKRKLSRRWTDFDIDYYSEDEEIFVIVSVDDLGE